jgi:hypothetical protein
MNKGSCAVEDEQLQMYLNLQKDYLISVKYYGRSVIGKIVQIDHLGSIRCRLVNSPTNIPVYSFNLVKSFGKISIEELKEQYPEYCI